MIQSSERMDWHNANTRMNSEIHASLRRLEDADYIGEQVMTRQLGILGGQLDEAEQRLTTAINSLNEEVYQLHTYIEPHLYDDDLKFFQDIYVGNLQVSDGGYIEGNLTISGSGTFTVDKTILANNGIDIYEGALFTPLITMPAKSGELSFTPHKLKVNGREADGYILATKDVIV